MKKEFSTEQENFWTGNFGDDYVDRNNSQNIFYSRIAIWGKMLHSANNIKSAMELGCNIGINLFALNKLRPDMELKGIEINEKAALKARELGVASIANGTILEPIEGKPVDLTFTSGVLIHINPDSLKKVYDNLVNKTNRYVLVNEYYNPAPIEVTYRNHSNKLFKRDFAGELIEQYNLKLVDYGFIYKRDNCNPMDDSTWFLLEK